jgi:hypothetical protein
MGWYAEAVFVRRGTVAERSARRSFPRFRRPAERPRRDNMFSSTHQEFPADYFERRGYRRLWGVGV